MKTRNEELPSKGPDADGEFPLQVAGHGDMKIALGGLVLIKKNRGFELDNYCRFLERNKKMENIRSCVPRFLGTIILDGSQMFYSPDEIASQVARWKLFKLQGTEICIENIVARFQDPCAVDVKIGRIFYNRLTDPCKVARCKEKARAMSVENLGVVISGASHWQQAREASEACSSTDEFASVLMRSMCIQPDHDKYDQRPLAVIVESMLQQLHRILKETVKIVSQFSFISTSILLAYDKSEALNTQESESCRGAIVKLIDFSNCVPMSPHGFCDSQIGYHEGLLNLIDSFKIMHRRIMERAQAEIV